MSKKILITGANGFIGSKLVEYYLKSEYQVFGLGRSKNYIKDKKFDYINGDIQEMDLLKCLKEIEPEVIIHCAGSADVSFSIENPEIDFERNVVLLHKLLFAIKRLDKKIKVIFLSSAAVYGNYKNSRMSEEECLNPMSPYAVHKKMCEDLCVYFNKINQFDISILRIFSAYGPGLKKQIFWDMNTKLKKEGKLELFGTGEEIRDFIYIDDLIDVVSLIEKSSLSEKIFNIGNGEGITIKEIAEIFLKNRKIKRSLLSFKNKNRQGDPNIMIANIEKVKQIGYKPKVSIEKGIKNYVEWLKKEENE